MEWGSRICVWDIRFCHQCCSEAQKESRRLSPTHSCPNLEERPQRQSRKGRILAPLRPVVEPSVTSVTLETLWLFYSLKMPGSLWPQGLCTGLALVSLSAWYVLLSSNYSGLSSMSSLYRGLPLKLKYSVTHFFILFISRFYLVFITHTFLSSLLNVSHTIIELCLSHHNFQCLELHWLK